MVVYDLISSRTVFQLCKLTTQFISKRCLHQSAVSCGRFWESNPKGEYRDEEAREKAYKENMQRLKKNMFGFKDGFKDLREEIAKWKNELHDHFTNEHWTVPGDRDMVWKFDNAEKLKTWRAVSDNMNNEGFSRCEFKMSPSGKALFQGYVNTTAPKDGRVKWAGFCSIKSDRAQKSFKRDSYLDWSDYSHLILRVRGDGRQYTINLNTPGYYDITWHDTYSYYFYTRGGPYWQEINIPFSKFFFGHRGRVQDLQEPFNLDRVASVSITTTKVDGPFSLELDYIAVEYNFDACDEEFAYETYTVPRFVAGV